MDEYKYDIYIYMNYVLGSFVVQRNVGLRASGLEKKAPCEISLNNIHDAQ